MTRILALIIVTVAINFGAPLVAQTDNGVTYQGQLKLNGSPITNMGPGCDFEFSLFAR